MNDGILLIRKKLLDITETLPIYKLGIQSGILIEETKLHYNTYVSIISINNYKGDFNYTEKFIESYTNYLDDQFKLVVQIISS